MSMNDHRHKDGHDSTLMLPLAQHLMQDSDGTVKEQYCAIFENLQNHASANLRTPMSSEEYALNKSVFDIAEIASQVVSRFWDRCHGI